MLENINKYKCNQLIGSGGVIRKDYTLFHLFYLKHFPSLPPLLVIFLFLINFKCYPKAHAFMDQTLDQFLECFETLEGKIRFSK